MVSLHSFQAIMSIKCLRVDLINSLKPLNETYSEILLDLIISDCLMSVNWSSVFPYGFSQFGQPATQGLYAIHYMPKPAGIAPGEIRNMYLLYLLYVLIYNNNKTLTRALLWNESSYHKLEYLCAHQQTPQTQKDVSNYKSTLHPWITASPQVYRKIL